MDFLLEPLNLVTFFPLLGVFILFLLKNEQKDIARYVAMATALFTFGLSIWVWTGFDASFAGLQLNTLINESWFDFAGWEIRYGMGVDGISIMMVLLTGLMTPIAILSTWKAVDDRVRDFMIFFLLLEVGMMGVFLAQDLFLFYVFWEFTLIPMYFLIGIWGGKERMYASIKFFLYTMSGSLLMLLAILWLGINQGSFYLPQLMKVAMSNPIPPDIQIWLFAAFAIAFAIKVPMWPLHSWLPDAHVQAPTAGSVILAGVLLKMGTYGFIRFNLQLFPEAAIQAAPVMATLAVIGILYGAAVSFSQTDAKKLVAYSSISHLGFVMLGIFSLNEQGIQGAILQMVNHGISTGALFLIVGFVYERRHTREFSQFGGLWNVTPVYAVLTLIVALSSMGLPGLNGFVGEFTILLGAFGAGLGDGVLANSGGIWYAALAAGGVILAAIYMLYMFREIFLGPVTVEANKSLKDLTPREIATLLPLLVFIFWIGLYPKPFFGMMAASVENLVEFLGTAAHVVLH